MYLYSAKSQKSQCTAISRPQVNVLWDVGWIVHLCAWMFACGYVCFCSQMPKQVMPLELHLVDTEAARQRIEQFSLANDQMAAAQGRLRSNRFVCHSPSSFSQLVMNFWSGPSNNVSEIGRKTTTQSVSHSLREVVDKLQQFVDQCIHLSC